MGKYEISVGNFSQNSIWLFPISHFFCYRITSFYRHKKIQVVLIMEVVEVGGDRDQAANFKPGLISSAESKTRK